MCAGCWTAHYDKTKTLPPDGLHLVKLIRDLYAQHDGRSGGPLHVVLEDWNLDDENIALYDIKSYRRKTQLLAIEIYEHFKELTVYERAAVLARHEGFWS